MREGRKTRMMESCDQEPCRNANGIHRVVTLKLSSIAVAGKGFVEHHNQPGSRFQEWFVRIGTQWRQGIAPFIRYAPFVEFPLFGLCGIANRFLDGDIGNSNKTPWLLMRAAGRAARSRDSTLDDVAQHQIGGEIANRSAAVYLVVEVDRAMAHYIDGQTMEIESDARFGQVMNNGIDRSPITRFVVVAIHRPLFGP